MAEEKRLNVTLGAKKESKRLLKFLSLLIDS